MMDSFERWFPSVLSVSHWRTVTSLIIPKTDLSSWSGHLTDMARLMAGMIPIIRLLNTLLDYLFLPELFDLLVAVTCLS